MSLPQKSKGRPFIHTGLQPGDERQPETQNRFNGNHILDSPVSAPEEQDVYRYDP